jgi:transposase-like protein/ribosomal protein S27AE
MSRRGSRPEAKQEQRLEVQQTKCVECGQEMWVAYHKKRKIMTLAGLCHLTLVIRSCRNPECRRYKCAFRPEEEGRFALPHGECGLDVIALVGTLRYREHRSIKEIHEHLKQRNVQVCERTVEHALHRYEELVAVHLHERERLHKIFKKQERVVLAIDGLQPDVGHEVLWVIREVISGEILVARALLSSAQQELATLLKEAREMLPEKVEVRGIVSDGQQSIRLAVATVFPDNAHQLCHFHYLREAAKPIYEADRHAKKELKKQVRGIRPIEQSLEGKCDRESEVTRDYCLAVRSAITDDGHPPLAASGLKLHHRLQQISDSISRVAEKRGPSPTSSTLTAAFEKSAGEHKDRLGDS